VSDEKPFFISHLVSAIGNALCMFFFPYLLLGSFKELFIPWHGQQTLNYLVGRILSLQVHTTTGCIIFIGASICIVSASIHLILFSTGRKRFATRYGFMRNISVSVVLISVIVYLFDLMNSPHQNL
jgi:hypothetical protein